METSVQYLVVEYILRLRMLLHTPSMVCLFQMRTTFFDMIIGGMFPKKYTIFVNNEHVNVVHEISGECVKTKLVLL